MNLVHLKYAVEVVKTGSITKAAENLFMSQPNLSKAIKELESELQIKLFTRSTNGVVPTEEGERLLCCARDILSQIDQMEQRYGNRDNHRQSLYVAFPRANYMAHAFTRLAQKLDPNREIMIHYVETNMNEAIKQVSSGDSSFGIIRFPVTHEAFYTNLLQNRGITVEPLFVFSYLLLLSEHHPLIKQPEISLKQLDDYIEIVNDDPFLPSSENFDITELPLSTSKRIYVSERCTQMELLSSIPNTYMWISPQPATILSRYGLVQRVCKQVDRSIEDAMIYMNKHPFTELERKLVKELKLSCKELREQ